MEATTIESAVDSLLAPQENSEETVEATEEPTQDVESDFEEEAADEEVIEASDDDGEAEYEDDATEYTDEVEAVEDDSDALFDVTIDGRQERWTLSQLKQSAAGQGYIQQKMRENADVTKQLQEREAQLAQREQHVLQITQQVQQGGLQAPTPPSKENFENDPIGYMEEKMEYDAAVQEYNAKVGQIRQLQQKQQQEAQAQRQTYMQEQARLLAEAIPDIVHPEKGDNIKKGLMDTGVAYGFSEQEMANVIDHRYIRALNDARKWRELQANKVKAKEKGSNVRPVIKSGAKRRTDGVTATRRKQEAKAMKSGNIADMADLLINPKL